MSFKNKVRLRLRLDHQVQFGDHVAIRGSTKELGSWKNNVPLHWTENGWVCDLEFKGTHQIEFKFVTVNKDNTLLWEDGENRVLKFPGGGNFATVTTWNATQENLELHILDESQEPNREESEHDATSSVSEAEASPFVGQWQGKAISFMQSNDHRDHETHRKWDTSGLQGLSLKLVQADQNARNWWRKVSYFLSSIFSNFKLNCFLCCLFSKPAFAFKSTFFTLKLDIVRDIISASLQGEDRLEALLYSAIYLKVLFSLFIFNHLSFPCIIISALLTSHCHLGSG